MNPALREVARFVRQHREFMITTHMNPDGDAVGSAVGLCLALRKLGKDATVCMADPVPESFRFLPGTDQVIAGKDKMPDRVWDAVIVVDSANLERTGLFEDNVIPSRVIINIDHHLSCSEFGSINWVEPKASAAGEMVFDLARALSVELDRDIAVNLYASILTDTGFFRYSSTTPKTHRVAARLMETGFNAGRLAEQIYESRSYSTLKLLGEFLAGMERSDDGRVAWSTLTNEMFDRTGTDPADTEGFINYPRSVKGVEVAVLFRENGHESVKVSLRSKGGAGVSAFAERFGGGGHHSAAGCTISGSIDDVRRKVVADLLKDRGGATS